jgi:hypothetical protein
LRRAFGQLGFYQWLIVPSPKRAVDVVSSLNATSVNGLGLPHGISVPR